MDLNYKMIEFIHMNFHLILNNIFFAWSNSVQIIVNAQNEDSFSFSFSFEMTRSHNIIQIHNNVLWDCQYSTKYSSYSI